MVTGRCLQRPGVFLRGTPGQAWLEEWEGAHSQAIWQVAQIGEVAMNKETNSEIISGRDQCCAENKTE